MVKLKQYRKIKSLNLTLYTHNSRSIFLAQNSSFLYYTANREVLV